MPQVFDLESTTIDVASRLAGSVHEGGRVTKAACIRTALKQPPANRVKTHHGASAFRSANHGERDLPDYAGFNGDRIAGSALRVTLPRPSRLLKYLSIVSTRLALETL